MRDELKLFVARLVARRVKHFLDRSLVAVLDLHRTREWESGCRALHAIHDGLRVVAGYQGYLRPESGQLANRVQIQDQILVHGHAPALQQAGEGIVVRDLGASDLQRRIEHE